MIKELVMGAASVTALFVNSPDEPVNTSQMQQEVNYNLSEQIVPEAAINDSLSFSERLLFMKPAKVESIRSKELKETVKENLEKKEIERAKQETERLTEEEKKKVEEEWKNNFPVYEGDSPEATFLNEISRDSVEIAYKNNIYPSVMMAQAGLESNWGRSGLAKNYNNLMGTKGSWKGKTVKMRTREDVGGQSIYINAGFSVYDSWADSLERYGGLLRNGPNGNASFYAGAWRSNAESYKDATSWLQGRYATDTKYASKLNQTIERYNLSQFDNIIPLDEELKEIEVIVEPESVLLEAPQGAYEVQAGDSLFSIALMHDMKVIELMKINALQSPLLEENQWLVIDVNAFVDADEEDVKVFEEISQKELSVTTLETARKAIE